MGFSTPMEDKYNSGGDTNIVNHTKAVGMVIHLAVGARLDIAFTACLISKLVEHPTIGHRKDVKHLFCIMKFPKISLGFVKMVFVG